MLGASLRDRRQALLEQADLQGAAFCRAYAAEADAWLASLADRATEGYPRRLALVAVGGYGRGELSPYSDLDVVLVHEGHKDVAAIAEAIWYPVWDEGVHLDHSVRRPGEVLDAATGDLRVALGLLDARMVWGDARVAEPLIAKARELWRSRLGAAWLPTLAEQMDERRQAQGDVAFLLEPDLKEAHGGLRDVNVLRAIDIYAPLLGDYVDLASLEPAATLLTAVRVELHRGAGRELDRLLLQEQDHVAAVLAYPDADALMGAVSAAGRSIAWVSDDAWRRQRLWQPDRRRRPPLTHRQPAAGLHLGGPNLGVPAKGPAGGRGRDRDPHRPWSLRARRSAPPDPALEPATRDVEPGIAVVGGEAALTPPAAVSTDTSLPFRLAAVSAEQSLPIARGALHRLADKTPPPADPWPIETREALVRVLATGHAAIDAMEALDHHGLLARLLPEWAAVRNKPQRNAYHRFTVDRHLLETAANGAQLAANVDRPDLLLVGCLLHDIGKGHPGDHTEVGITLVKRIAGRMGFTSHDVGTLVTLCRYHLLLPDTATRRDLDDPTTIDQVAAAIGDPKTLHLLAALTEADSLATGPSAWGTWKAGLVAELVDRVEQHMTGQAPARRRGWVTDDHRTMMDTVRQSGRALVRFDPPRVVVAAPDRRGLLASVAGTLALHGLDVRSADVAGEDGVATEIFTVEIVRGSWPDSARLRGDLDAVLSDRLALEEKLAAKAEAYAGGRRPSSAVAVTPSVTVDNSASASSTVVEVRAADELGLLHRVTRALFDCDLDVVTARVSTIGDAVVDAFYVRNGAGHKVTDASLLGRLQEAVRAAIA